MSRFGRRLPPDWTHVQNFPLRRKAPVSVEKSLILPQWHLKHDQGDNGACVGHGNSMMLAILNENECRRQGEVTPYIRYNPFWLWDRAKEVDGFPETNPGDDEGTTVRAACKVLIDTGHVTWPDESDHASISKPNPSFGIGVARWATTVDEMRAAINADLPCAIGINWYSSFDVPKLVNGEWWIAKTSFGTVEGGHCTCIYGASDARQAFRQKNSWGKAYPEVWIPYKAMARLLKEEGECALVTDR